uniref:ABC-2 type transporter transmembrane domain-containing protein n=1 Tax=Cuerna arida TaxID=1464854 RepID=A0A1B6FR40_9HEMI
MQWYLVNLHILAVLIFIPPAVAFILQFHLSNSLVTNLPLAIVSPELTDGQATCSTFQRTECDGSGRPFTCRLLDLLTDSSLDIALYDNLKEAKMAARKNKVWGVLHFNELYTDALAERMNFDLFSTNDTVVNASFIDVYMDMSNMLISSALMTELYEDVRSMIQEMLQDCGYNPKIFDIPIQKMPPIYGSNNPSLLEFAIPGVLCAISFCMAVIYGITSVMFERTIGLERSFVAGLSKLELMTSHFTFQMVIAVLQQLLMLLVFYCVYNNPHRGNMYLAFLLLLLVHMLGSFFAQAAAIAHATERAAMTTGFGSVQILFLIGGVLWPAEGMHGILRNITWAIPVQPAVEAYRAIVMRDWKISHPVVYKGFLSTSAWTVIFLVMTIALARNRNFTL